MNDIAHSIPHMFFLIVTDVESLKILCTVIILKAIVGIEWDLW